jgi:hypothetical protein
MKRSGEPGWHRSGGRVAAIALVGVTLGLGTLPRGAYGAFTCTGDCNGNDAVSLTEAITLIDFALGTKTDLSTCPSGIPADVTMASQVTVATIIQAVNIMIDPNKCVVGPPGVCGDGVVNTGEDCDVGGTCLGGTNAGTHCTAPDQCMGSGVCIGGSHAEAACTSDDNCSGGKCVHCVTQGGAAIAGDSTHTCAANCTFETQIPYNLQQGVLDTNGNLTGGSGATVHGDTLTIPLALSGQSAQTISAGKQNADGSIPFIIKAASIQYPAIPVQTLACACVRGEAAKTCGGTLFELDGKTQSTDCTDGFTAGASVCPADKPCAFVHGPGNAATGLIACGENGTEGINIDMTQDDLDGNCAGGASACTNPPTITFSGTGPKGSVLSILSNAIGTVIGSCSSFPTFCSDTDPQSQRGTIATIPLTTGIATCTFTNANGLAGNTVCNCRTGDPACLPALCTSPWTVTGTPIDCAKAVVGDIKGNTQVNSFTSPGQMTIGDACVATVLIAN